MWGNAFIFCHIYSACTIECDWFGVHAHAYSVGTVEVKIGSHSIVLIMLQCRFCIGKKTLNNFLQIQRLILCTVVLTILLYCNVDATNVCASSNLRGEATFSVSFGKA